MNIEEKIVNVITQILTDKYGITADEGMVMIEIPKDNGNGDYSTNIATEIRCRRYMRSKR